jgi:hypothetical protein
MRWMRTNVLQNLTPPMYTSKLAFSYFAMDRPMVCQFRQVHRYLKMSILKHTKLPVLLVLQDPNGATQLHRLHQDLPMDPSTAGEVDLRRSTHHHNHQIHTISESPLVVQSRHLPVDQAQGKSSK